MLLQSGEDFAREVRDNWAGRDVEVSKTVAMPEIRLKIKNARVVGWKDVDRRIQQKHGPDTDFLVVAGTASEDEDGSKARAVIIPVDPGTVYDVREKRLVVLTDREVVEFRPAVEQHDI